jgi:hypothetical protein
VEVGSENGTGGLEEELSVEVAELGVDAGLGLPVVEGVCSWERKSWRRRWWRGEGELRVRLLAGISRRRER